MSFIFEIIAYIVGDLLFSVPGAIVRWAYLRAIGEKETLKDVIADKKGLNALISIAMFLIVVLIIYLIS